MRQNAAFGAPISPASNDVVDAVMDRICGAHEHPVAAAAPRQRSPSTPYDNADYHADEPEGPQSRAESGASHLGLVIAWIANHGLLRA